MRDTRIFCAHVWVSRDPRSKGT